MTKLQSALEESILNPYTVINLLTKGDVSVDTNQTVSLGPGTTSHSLCTFATGALRHVKTGQSYCPQDILERHIGTIESPPTPIDTVHPPSLISGRDSVWCTHG